jgi:hypothetical protein
MLNDLFGGNIGQIDDFHWIVAVFAGSGASDAIKVAHKIPLKTYFPVRFNGKNEPIPMWRNYLFIEFREQLTLQICRKTTKFLKILSFHDEEDVLRPILVRKNAINEHIEMMMQGKFNEKYLIRRFYGRGSIVRVIDGNFIDKRVRLEIDVEPNMPGSRKIPIDINGCKGKIELYKLAL